MAKRIAKYRRKKKGTSSNKSKMAWVRSHIGKGRKRTGKRRSHKYLRNYNNVPG